MDIARPDQSKAKRKKRIIYAFDAVVRSKWELAAGQTLTWRAAYSRSAARLTRVGPTPPGLAVLGVTTPLFDLSEEIRLTRGQPRDNLRLAATWDVGRFSAMLRLMRYGEVETVALSSMRVSVS